MISLKEPLLPRITGGDLMDELLVHQALDCCFVALYSLILQVGIQCWQLELCLYSVILDDIVGHS